MLYPIPLCKGGRLDDAVAFCVEMFEAGHSPNAATFVGLVDALCKTKGVEEGEKLVRIGAFKIGISPLMRSPSGSISTRKVHSSRLFGKKKSAGLSNLSSMCSSSSFCLTLPSVLFS
jgi:pentatricopeptide repeat protein